jgi:hypothetical protein
MTTKDGSPVEVPDIVVAFNYDAETERVLYSRSSLAYVLDKGWPLLMTAYGLDTAMLCANELGRAAGKGRSAKILAGPCANPYGSAVLRQDFQASAGAEAAARAGAGSASVQVEMQPQLAMDQFYGDSRFYVLAQGTEARA